MSIDQIPRLISSLYKVTNELNSLFPNRPFTPDGHLVGSIGEVVAAYVYGVQLERCSTPSFDGKFADGSKVEIKLTGGDSINISKADEYANHLIVLKLIPETGFLEIYAGPFPSELVRSRKMNKRGFTSITTKTLEKINPSMLKTHGRLMELNAFFTKSIP